MGFWDVIMGVGKSASNAAAERIKKNHLDAWEKIKISPVERINDFYKQNNTSNCNRPSFRGLAISALYLRGGEYERLWREDQNAVDWLKSFRVKISLDTSDSAEELRRVIDHLVERC